jgi:hypothetical protein
LSVAATDYQRIAQKEFSSVFFFFVFVFPLLHQRAMVDFNQKTMIRRIIELAVGCQVL